ncbi:hypothetical protein QTP88_010145 [Uroleucon formosanum]
MAEGGFLILHEIMDPISEHYQQSMYMTGGNNNAFIPSLLANYKLKKLPFYDVIEDIKPTLLEFRQIYNYDTFGLTMTNKQANLITMNQNTSFGKTDYEYQEFTAVLGREPQAVLAEDILWFSMSIRTAD